ncbi:carboxypeptidase-like regulatory domain-containing protein [archaeon]|nr:carboxypeptidase-like regulatory domain-containing protein [archaeon]
MKLFRLEFLVLLLASVLVVGCIGGGELQDNLYLSVIDANSSTFVAGASVTIYDIDDVLVEERVFEDNGTISLYLPPGDYRVVFNASDYDGFESYVSISGEDVESVEVSLSNIVSCVEDWSCTDWSVCSNGFQRRSCLDAKSCGTNEYEPSQERNCMVIPEAECEEDEECDDSDSCTVDSCVSGNCSNEAVQVCQSGDDCCPLGCAYVNDTDCSEEDFCNSAADCYDADNCTFDSCLSGSCSNPQIVTCKDDDDCCPTGCDHTDDNDCVVIDECDNNADCDDDDDCTNDVCASGEPRECSNTQITSCTNNDDCCPSSCTNLNDNDCSCSVASDCNDSNECTIDTCSGGSCSNTNAANNTSCASGVCCSGSCVSPGCSLGTVESDCGQNTSCMNYTCSNPGTCEAECVEVPFEDNISCGTGGQLCCEGFCVERCNATGGCTNPTPECAESTCIYPGTCNAFCNLTLNHSYCDDQEECTVDTCDLDNGCEYAALDEGTSCVGGVCCDGVCTNAICWEDSQCDDFNVCTIDTCFLPCTESAECYNLPIVICTDDDDCCPPGCNSTNDNDCT